MPWAENHFTNVTSWQHGNWQYQEQGWELEMHMYASASLFTVLAFLCLFTALRLRSQLAPIQDGIPLNGFLGIMATGRLLVLFLDPYGSKQILPRILLQLVWDLGYPCLLSAFSLLSLSVSREEVVSVCPISENTASICITIHFCLVITAAVLCAVLVMFWLVTQVVFVVLSSFFFFFTFLGCLRVLREPLAQVDPGCDVSTIRPMFAEVQIYVTDVEQRTIHLPGNLKRRGLEGHNQEGNKHHRLKKRRQHLKQLLFTTCMGLLLCLFWAYELLGGHLLPWLLFQTISRFVELVMAYAMVCASQRTSRHHHYYRN